MPQGGFQILDEKIRDYINKNTPQGKPANEALVASIASIQLSVLQELWTEEGSPFPDASQPIAWEAWLRSPSEELYTHFLAQCNQRGLSTGKNSLEFPDRRVVLIFGTATQLSSFEIFDALAELRLARTPPSTFDEMPPHEQGAWGRELLSRITKPAPHAPVVCVLDTGVTNNHPLLAPLLPTSNMFSYLKSWGFDDHAGHGTEMAGLAGYGDLTIALESTGPLELKVGLESVKILPPPPEVNAPELYGAITIDAAGQVEVAAPERLRVFSMSVTTRDGRTAGRPSSWSAAIDRLAAGADDGRQRLFCICAGNADPNWYLYYPESVALGKPLDPAQAWNALTIGAYTEKAVIAEPSLSGWLPIAPHGDSSPTSTSSVTFDKGWPNKPDLVLEGGNVAMSGGGSVPPDDSIPSLMLLTTDRMRRGRLFTSTNATSAATAQGANMAAQLWAEYPSFNPETIRALLVHSARWTRAMIARTNSNKDHRVRLYGYGVPDLTRALWSAHNALTLIVEDELRPYTAGKLQAQMRFHTLPWPTEELQRLGAADVRLRVTLSYFIEPNPAQRGWMGRFRYQSHGLRFAVRRPAEKDTSFLARLNKAMQHEDYTGATGTDSGWELGETRRNRGSIHSDVWQGSAAELATRGTLAVFPVGGWKADARRLEKPAAVRFSLVVSIETDEENVDLYTPVATELGVPI
ncbi:S8 family peptidase [Myxococcus sp. AM001]|nr:S8 family peptidase [Myxococcus sp. AM001]